MTPPFRKSATIVHGNVLRTDWQSLIDTLPWEQGQQKYDYILGNPRFIGKTWQTSAQREDIDLVLQGVNGAGVLNYVNYTSGMFGEVKKGKRHKKSFHKLMSMAIIGKSVSTDESIMRNIPPNTLYHHNINDKLKCFQIVIENETETHLQISSKTLIKFFYDVSKENFQSLKIIKEVSGGVTQELTLSKFTLSHIRDLLLLISSINLKGVISRKLFLAEEKLSIEEKNIEIIKTLFSTTDGEDLLIRLIEDGLINRKDIVNNGYRKIQLNNFRQLLEIHDYWESYCGEVGISDSSEEKAWQHFFEANQWIFGYGLDYKFLSILQREAHISEEEIDGTNSVITDYLMGDKHFTTFVEIKKPSTPLYGNRKNRSGSWCLSDDLIYAVSQILEHKAAGQIKLDKEHYIKGEPLKQKAYDSKVILLIGNWSELKASSNTLEGEIKKKTLEIYRRDSRNIEIITFDELFDRAKFIVEGDIKTSQDELEDLPF